MTAPTERLRVFFALWPDASVARALAGLATMIAPESARLMRPETLHLTLAFVGDIDAAQLATVIDAGDAVTWPRFELTIDQVAHWAHNHIVWAGASRMPAPLGDLASGLADALGERGFSLPERPFKPHVTLARKAATMEESSEFVPIDWHVREGVLVCSDRDALGGHYQVLRRWSCLPQRG